MLNIRSATADMTGDEIARTQALIDSYYWHHGMEFGNGLATRKSSSSIEAIGELGESLFHGFNLSQRSVLDLGAWNGAFSFMAKELGAARVVACDKHVWDNVDLKGRETFELARRLKGLEVEAYELDLADARPQFIGKFDVVLFAGIFYHLLDAVTITKQVSECASHVFVLETHQDALEMKQPAMILYPGTSLGGDGSNWWGPNPYCLFELLTEIGFAQIFYRPAPGSPYGGRGVYHAFRDVNSWEAMGRSNYSAPWVDLADPIPRSSVFGID